MAGEKGPRLTTGLLVRRVDLNNYDKELWKIAYDHASSRAQNLLLVAGHSSFDQDPSDVADSAIYAMLNPRLIDTCVVSQTVALWGDADAIEQFSKELPKLPLVTTSIRFGTHPCVLVDNASGLRALMRHLIREHGCRRIVHVRGPFPNREAQQREDVWREELLLAGITPEPTWLVQGHFARRELKDIGQKVMLQTDGVFDAVVACNDEAALRIIEDFQFLGYRVPEDYRVCGFDDVEAARYSSPTLTTVKQPLERLYHECWTGLEACISTGTGPADRTVESTLAVRGSCGCPGGPGERNDPATLVASHHQTIASLLAKVRDSTEFDRTMNQVTSLDALKAALLAWLPRIGMARFAILQSCTHQGIFASFDSQRVPGRPVATGPEAFRVFMTVPEVAIDTKKVIVSSELALKPWFGAIEPFVVGTFPLVVGSTWYGLAFLELSRDAGVWERSVQEQVASVFHRLSLERRTLEEKTRTLAKTEQLEAQDRLVSEVAHEINTPLGAILSSSGSLEIGLRDTIERSARFYASLSPEGLRVYERLAKCRPQGPGGRPSHQERVQRGTLSRLLARMGLLDPTLAEELVGIGWDGSDDELTMVAGLADFEEVVHYLSGVEDLATSSRVITVAAEKVSTFVARLVVATQTELKNRETG